MTREEKDLLLKDLSARLPYGVIVETPKGKGHVCDINLTIFGNEAGVNIKATSRDKFDIEDIQPYLFPLSSMTEEQYNSFIIVSGWDGDYEDIKRGKFSCIGYIGLDYIYDTIDWLNKNHFDYRGLIPEGLAIDATGLNIY